MNLFYEVSSFFDKPISNYFEAKGVLIAQFVEGHKRLKRLLGDYSLSYKIRRCTFCYSYRVVV